MWQVYSYVGSRAYVSHIEYSFSLLIQMSLSLVQGYESPEEEDPRDYFTESDEEYPDDGFEEKETPSAKPSKLQKIKPPPRTSDLPTAFEMFTEVVVRS